MSTKLQDILMFVSEGYSNSLPTYTISDADGDPAGSSGSWTVRRSLLWYCGQYEKSGLNHGLIVEEPDAVMRVLMSEASLGPPPGHRRSRVCRAFGIDRMAAYPNISTYFDDRIGT